MLLAQLVKIELSGLTSTSEKRKEKERWVTLVFTSSCKCVWGGCISQRQAALRPAKSSIMNSSTLIAHITHISLTKRPSHAVLYPGTMQTSVTKPWASSVLLHTHYIYYIGDSNRFQLCGGWKPYFIAENKRSPGRCKRIKHTCSKRRQPRYEHVCDVHFRRRSAWALYELETRKSSPAS